MSESMNLEEYRELVEDHEVPTYGDRHTYFALGVSGEAGEVADAVKKFRRREDPPGDFQVSSDPFDVVEELGDLLWYVDRLADSVGYTVGEILAENAEKIERRYEDAD